MRRLARRLLASVAVLGLVLLGVVADPRPAFACSCVPTGQVRAAREADVVFRGTVTAARPVGRGEDARTDLRFAVDAVFKGTVYADQVVATPRGGDGCGLTPEVGTTWVIYAVQSVEGRGDDAVARLVTDSCRGNLSTVRAPITLGTPRPPEPGASDREERATGADRFLSRGLAIAGIVVLGLGAVAVGGLVALWRPGRRR